MTQGTVSLSNLPPQLPVSPVSFDFAGTEIEGTYLELGIKPVKAILVLRHADRYYTSGGDFDQVGLLLAVGELPLARS